MTPLLLQIDPGAAADAARNAPGAVQEFVQDMTMTLASDLAPRTLEAGIGIWEGMAAIVIAWHGIKLAFGAGAPALTLVQALMTLLIPRTLLWLYGTPWTIGGVALNPPQMIVSQGAWMTGVILEDAPSRMMRELVAIGEIYAAVWTGAGGCSGGWDCAASVFDMVLSVVSAIPILATGLLLALGLLLMGFMALGLLIWSGFGIAIVSIMGPLFVPWLAFQPMSFLFWNWFRTLLTLSLYAPLAACVLRVFGVGAAVYARSALEDQLLGAGAAGLIAGETLALKALAAAPHAKLAVLGLALLPVIAGVVAVMRVPSLAAGLVGGANFGGMGELVGAAVSTGSTLVVGRLGGAAAAARLPRRAAGGGG